MKNYFEARDNEHQKETQDSHRHRHHDDRVNHGREDLVFNLRGFLLKFGKPVKHEFEHAADLASLDHVDVQIVEDFRMHRSCVGKSTGALHTVSDLADCFFQHLIAFLLSKNI